MRRKIGIAGAGIAGLCSAALLARAGNEVTILDRFDAPAPIGSGLVLQPVGQAVLAELDQLDNARSLGQCINAMLGLESATGRTVLDVSYGARFGLAMHRASLFQVLLDAARKAGARLVTSAEVTGFDAPRILSKTQSFGPFDLIINASGANSPLSPIRTRTLPYGAIWTTVPWPEGNMTQTDLLQQRYRRADRMIGLLPVGRLPHDPQPLATLFWSLHRDGHDDWRSRPLDHWKAEVTTLWPELAPFLTTVTRHEQMTMTRYTQGALLNPLRNRVLHIGDSAHRTSPQLGQGANMALLDSAALARALQNPDLDIALLNYRRARRAHVWAYQAMSAAFTPMYQSDSSILPWLRDRLLYPLSTTRLAAPLLTRLVCGDLVPPMGSLCPRKPQSLKPQA